MHLEKYSFRVPFLFRFEYPIKSFAGNKNTFLLKPRIAICTTKDGSLPACPLEQANNIQETAKAQAGRAKAK